MVGHLLALAALFLALDLGLWLIPVALFWGSSAWWHLRHEQQGRHPDALLWNSQDGWRLEYPEEIRPITPPGLLRLGQCLLIEAGHEVFFLPPVPGSQRLRRLLLQG
jgi:hypothetical protein